MPDRIQLKRAKGWRKPEGAIVVSRPSRWGNPFVVGIDGDVDQCVNLYRRWLNGEISEADTNWRLELKARGMNSETIWMGKQLIWAGHLDSLRGHDLCCWCPLDQPCHADYLLMIANQE